MKSGNVIEALTVELEKIRSSVKPSDDPAWRRPPALRVIDCVLSLNRRYDGFVVPRLEHFQKTHPTTKNVSHLRDQMVAASSHYEYVAVNLNYRDSSRAETLFNVVAWLSDIAGGGDDKEQLIKLETWAGSAPPDGYKALCIRGFALAGWQYLRMLFGANTTKPDVHILRFVEKATGEKLSPEMALAALESASKVTGVNLRDLDTTIWEGSARATLR